MDEHETRQAIRDAVLDGLESSTADHRVIVAALFAAAARIIARNGIAPMEMATLIDDVLRDEGIDIGDRNPFDRDHGGDG